MLSLCSITMVLFVTSAFKYSHCHTYLIYNSLSWTLSNVSAVDIPYKFGVVYNIVGIFIKTEYIVGIKQMC